MSVTAEAVARAAAPSAAVETVPEAANVPIADATVADARTPQIAPPACEQVWFDGALVDAGAPRADLTTHAMHYGSGVFEGIRAYATDDGGGAVFRLPEHLERMRRGAELLGMVFDVERATGAVLATLRANGHRDAYIRPLAWLGAGGFGLDVEGHAQHLMVSTTATRVHLNGQRARIGISPWRRNPADALPPLKLCGGYVNSILAKREAKARGFEEALFVDHDGFVVECTGANVFLVRDGAVTAVAHRDALPGITRDTLIALAGADSRPVHIDELKDADEVFACGTAAEVAPVAQIEARVYGDNPVTRALAATYGGIVRGRSPAHVGWLTRV